MKSQFTPLLFVNMSNVDPIVVMDVAQEAGLETFVCSIMLPVYKAEEVFAMGIINPPGTRKQDTESMVFDLLAEAAPGYTCFFMDNEGMIQQASIQGHEDGSIGVSWSQVAEVYPTPTTFGTLKVGGKKYGINLNLDGETVHV